MAMALCWGQEAKVWLGPCVESSPEGGNFLLASGAGISLVGPLLHLSA